MGARFIAKRKITARVMAFPTAVNSQITDSVTQSHVQVVAAASSQALGMLYQAAAHAASLCAHNATAHQQNANQLALAVTTKCVNALLSAERPFSDHAIEP